MSSQAGTIPPAGTRAGRPQRGVPTFGAELRGLTGARWPDINAVNVSHDSVRRLQTAYNGCGLFGFAVFGQGTAFTYQGRLNANGAAANGSYDVAFTLFATNVTGTAIAGPVTNAAVGVSNGLFTTTVDFGVAFVGESNWLEIAVSTNGANAFNTLSPRQQLTPVPYALMAANVSGQVSLAQLPSSLVTNGASGVTISGTFSGNGAGVTNVPGTIPTLRVAATTVTTAANQAYVLTNNAFTTVTLPANANPGDVITISGLGSGGWQVVGPGQPEAGAPATYWSANNSPSGNWQTVASSADGSHLVAAGAQGTIWTSTNFGLTWTNNNNAPSAFWNSVASSADGTHLVAADFGNGDGGKIWTSANSGITWSSANNSPSTNWYSVASSADGTHLVAADYGDNVTGIGGQLWLSVNSGSTWSIASGAPSTNWNSVASSADGTHLIASYPSGPIYTSANSGVTWSTNSNTPFGRIWTSVASSADGTHLVAVSFDGTIYNSTNSGANWTNYNGNTFAFQNIHWISVGSSADGSRLITAPDIGLPIYTSINSGVTWSATNNNTPSAQWAAVASSGDGSHLIAAIGAGGQIWTATAPLFAGTQGTTVQFQYSNGGWVAGAANFTAWTVTNFPDVSGPLPTSFTFTSHGGRLLITAVGSGYPSVAGTTIGMIVQLDGVNIATNRIYGNQIIHMPFEAKTVIRNGVSAGSHTISLGVLTGTVSDGNDVYSATVQELPY